MFKRARQALHLGYLVGRAAVHVLVTQERIGAYCFDCHSWMLPVDSDRRSVVVRFGPRGRACPVHVAWRELIAAGALDPEIPKARSR